MSGNNNLVGLAVTDRLPSRKDLLERVLIAGGFIATTVAILFLMEQKLWCDCGNLSLWAGDIWSSHNSQHPLDPYFFTHVEHGIFLCGCLYWLPRSITSQWKFLIAVIVECGWEILENSPMIVERYRTATIALDYCGDSIANSVFDLLACALGYGIATMVGRRKSMLLVLSSELLMTLAVRDCLALNVIMLVYPLEAIKQWQLGG